MRMLEGKGTAPGDVLGCGMCYGAAPSAEFLPQADIWPLRALPCSKLSAQEPASVSGPGAWWGASGPMPAPLVHDRPATTGVVSHTHPPYGALAVPSAAANRSKATDQTYQQAQVGLRRSGRTRRAPAVTTASEAGELCQLTGAPTYHPASIEDYIMDGGPLLRQLNADPFVNEGEWEGCNRKRPMSTEQRLQHRKAVVQVLSQATADIERDAIADVEQAPANYAAAAKDPLWVESMEKEMLGLMKNGTYEPSSGYGAADCQIDMGISNQNRRERVATKAEIALLYTRFQPALWNFIRRDLQCHSLLA